MKTNKIYWLLGILLLMTSEVYSQKSATAIMNVSVKIISGSTITEVNQVDIDVNSKKVSYVEFDISPPKNIETKISSDSTFILTNQFGESITFESDKCISSGEDSQSVNLKVMLAESETNLRGQYKGNLISSISYF